MPALYLIKLMIEPSNIPASTEPPLPSPPGQEKESAGAPDNAGIVRAASILAAGNVASRIMGLARETVKANLFGASPVLAAFELAAYIPISLFDLIIGGMVNSSLVPIFSDYAAKEKREELWSILSAVLSVAIVALLAIIALVMLFASQLAWLVGAYEFDDPALTALSIRLMRLAAPAVLFLSVASILTGALYALKRFTLPAFVGAIFNGSIVVVALIYRERIEALVWGLLLGACLQILLQWPALRDARLRWQFNWRHPAIRRILTLYAPIVAGLAVNQLTIMISLNLATRTGNESVTYMKYATTLYQFPLGLVVTAISIATLPTLARFSIDQLTAFKQTLAEGIRLVMTLILPATAGLFALSVPIVALVFEHGNFTQANTLTTALVLRIYLFGLPFAAIDQMLVFAAYARKDTWRPALVGVVSNIVYLATAVLLLNPLGAPGLALAGMMGLAPGADGRDALANGLLSLMVADAVKHFVHALIMLWVLKKHVGQLGGYGVGRNALKSLSAGVITGGAAYLVTLFLPPLLPAAPFLGKLLLVIGGGAAGLLAYAGAVLLLDIPEAKKLHLLLRRRKQA